jgi:hypothetical protein
VGWSGVGWGRVEEEKERGRKRKELTQRINENTHDTKMQ